MRSTGRATKPVDVEGRALLSSLLAQFRPRALLGALPIFIFLGLRQVVGVEIAIVGGFGASLLVYLVNRAQSGVILALSTLAIVIGAIAAILALWHGDERVYFAGDPAWDFIMATLALGSMAMRRPLAGLVIHELVPGLRTVLPPRHAVFYVISLLVAFLFLFHGTVRTSLLLTDGSIERYIVLSRTVQWPTVALMVALIVWMVRRAATRAEQTSDPARLSPRADP